MSGPAHQAGPAARWVLAAILLVALTGCTIDHRKQDSVNDQVRWDVSAPIAARDLGPALDDGTLLVNTPGTEGVDVEVVLPGGDVVAGRWSLAAARDGDAGVVASVELSTSAEQDRAAWSTRIDDFVDRFGADRRAIDAYLAEVLPGLDEGRVDPGRVFPGEPRDGYEPTLSIRPGGGAPDPVDVVVEWRFALDIDEGPDATTEPG